MWFLDALFGGTRPRNQTRSEPPSAGAVFKRIPDQYNTIDEVSTALRVAGLEACQLIVGVDFTKSNTWTGTTSFNGRCLHDVNGLPNPYYMALSLIAQTLESFDDDNLIPCYGFGDVTTRGDSVFSFYANNEPAKGLNSLLARYKEIAPLVELSGPTSFAPLIRQAMRHVYHNGMQFHLLLIVADGQISSSCWEETKQAIVNAASFPIAIVMVGVGDGPWHAMKSFDDELPERRWDNFQFVEFNRIMSNKALATEQRRGASFALNALMELPDQYKIAEWRMGEKAKSQVKHIVANIPSTVVVEPPAYFDVPVVNQMFTNPPPIHF